MMKRLGLWLLVVCMLLSLACADGSKNDADDPNLGLYTAQTMTYSGFEMSVADLFEEGFTIELKSGGKATLKVDGETANGKWTLDGTAFTVNGGGLDCTGTLENGVMLLQYDEDTSIKLVNDSYKAPAAQQPSEGQSFAQSADSGNSAAQAADSAPSENVSASQTQVIKSEEFWLISYSMIDGNGNETTIQAADAGEMANTFLKMNDDHTAQFVLAGIDPIDMIWTDDGKLQIGGSGYTFDYATYTRIDDDSIDMEASGIVYHLSRRASDSAQAAVETEPEPVVTEAPAAPTEAPVATEAPAPTEAPVATEAPAPASVQSTGDGAPYGDSDGIISYEKLAGFYRWLKESPNEFVFALTFDDLGNAVGKAGFDRQTNDGKYASAYWTDEAQKYFVTVTFNNSDGKWTVSSFTTAMPSSEFNAGDISSFPILGNRLAGSSPTAKSSKTLKVGSLKFDVSVDLPTENWFLKQTGSDARFCLGPNANKAEYSHSYIAVEIKESLEKIDFYKDSFENLVELESRTIAGVEMAGRSYKNIGMNWIEYYGQIADGAWASIRLTGLAAYPGSEAEAILNSMQFTPAE